MSDDDDDLVRFATNLFYATEEQDEVELVVLRSGEPSNACRVRCFTQDLSGQAGFRYGSIDQYVEFASGQSEAVVRVPILRDSSWHTCEEFAVKLSDPQDCHIRGGGCRVKIIDQDYFPDNSLEQFILLNELDVVSRWTFASAFVRLCWNQAEVPWKASVSVVISMMHNAYFLLTIYLKVYLINVLLAKAAEAGKLHGHEGSQGSETVSERRLSFEGIDRGTESGGLFGEELLVPGNLEATALVVGMCYVIPFAILHILDLVRAKLGLAGALKTMLMSALFRRFMSYKSQVRQHVSDAEISMMCIRDIPELISGGVMSIFKLVEILCQILVTMVFLFMEDQLAIVPFAVYPVLAVIWMAIRRTTLREVQDAKVKAANDLVRGVHQACMNFGMILDYRKRSKAVDRFSATAMKYRKATGAGALVDINNGRFFPWLTTLSMAAYAVIGVQQLQEGLTNVGTFVATFGIFHEVGHELEAGYEIMIEMFQAFHAVKQLTYMLNLETDDSDRMADSRRRRRRLQIGGEMRRKKLKELQEPGQTKDLDRLIGDAQNLYQMVDDLLDIQLSNLTYVLNEGSKEIKILDQVSLELKQGKIITIASGERQGKSTVLQIIAGKLKPTAGHVFIPPHLQVLQVEDTPSFLPESLKRNLIFGVGDDDLSLASYERVKNICERLKFSDKLMRRLDQDWENLNKEDDDSWVSSLTSTDQMQIHLARAFISNPHVLVLHKPFMRFYNHTMQEAVMTAIQDFVNFRGLALAANKPEDVAGRRARTVIMTAFHATEIENADEVFLLANSVLRPISARDDVLTGLSSERPRSKQTTLKSAESLANLYKSRTDG